ncbi:MAG: hypothetical protein R3C49_19215 [Planctomycetaceae bacterium]
MAKNSRIAQIRTMTECNEFQYLLLGDLRDLLEETPDESNKRWLVEVLNVLVELMPRERHLFDEDGGYLSDVLDEFPGWDRRVLTMHLKKLHLDYSLRQLRDRIQNEESWVAVADQISCELRDWMEMFVDLHIAEGSLLMDAVMLDVGAAD